MEKFTTKKTKIQEAGPIARDLINTDITTTSELEFRMMIIKVLAGLKKSMKDIREIKILKG